MAPPNTNPLDFSELPEIDNREPLNVPYLKTMEERIAWVCDERGILATDLDCVFVPDTNWAKKKCDVCGIIFSSDKKTVWRHMRSKNHIHRLAKYLGVAPESLQGDDTIAFCDHCGEIFEGARDDTVRRHERSCATALANKAQKGTQKGKPHDKQQNPDRERDSSSESERAAKPAKRLRRSSVSSESVGEPRLHYDYSRGDPYMMLPKIAAYPGEDYDSCESEDEPYMPPPAPEVYHFSREGLSLAPDTEDELEEDELEDELEEEPRRGTSVKATTQPRGRCLSFSGFKRPRSQSESASSKSVREANPGTYLPREGTFLQAREGDHTDKSVQTCATSV